MTGLPAGGPRGPGGVGAGTTVRFADRMTGMEALMWRLERHDPRFRATMSLVVELGVGLPATTLRNRLEALCAAVPRLAARVRVPFLRTLRPAWEPDPKFSVDHHLSTRAGSVWEVAAGIVSSPFDPGRPPWRVVSVPEERAVVLHLHHSYTDGLGGVRLLGELFDLGAAGPARAPAGVAPGVEPGPGERVSEILQDVDDEVRRVADLWRRAVPWGVGIVAAARTDPGRFLASATDILDALQIHATAAIGPGSPLLADRSPDVHLSPVRMDLAALRRAASRIGVTVNDVFLAGLLDGLGRYHAKHGRVSPSVRLGLPISARSSDTEMRNQILGAVLRGPLGVFGSIDFDERARLVHEMVLHGRRQPWSSAVDDLAAGALGIPGAVRAVAAVMASLDVVASNVAGPPVPMWLAGVPVVSMTPFGPRSGSALNATLLSYDGSASIGLNADPAAVQPGVLSDCVAAAFEEAVGD